MTAPTLTRPLSPRQRDVLTLLAHSYTADNIAEILGCSVHTVTAHIRAVHRRLGAANRWQAIVNGYRAGELT